MDKLKTLKGAALVVATSMLPLSQAVMADVTISGWINEGVTYYDDGQSSDVVQISDNGTTLGSRMTFVGSSEVASGLTAGFEVILEPSSTGAVLGFGSSGLNDNANGHDIGVLGNSLNIGGAWGKLTVGLQSMPTDNIAVLEDPSLTLWSGISPVFRGNAVGIVGTFDYGDADNPDPAAWGDFLNCFTAEALRGGLGIGIDCNGIYRSGVRYDLPAFGPVTIAIGHANDDVYDVAVKYKGTLGRVTSQLALGYAVNRGVSYTPPSASRISSPPDSPPDVVASNAVFYSEARNFQMQGGLMDPMTGLFGSIAYQHEEADLCTAEGTTAACVSTPRDDDRASDSSDAWWFKVGVKKQWLSAGDTSIAFDYGQYHDQYGPVQARYGVAGSEVSRIGVSVDQYFGSALIVYGKWEQLELDVDGTATADLHYGNADELRLLTLGATYFF